MGNGTTGAQTNDPLGKTDLDCGCDFTVAYAVVEVMARARQPNPLPLYPSEAEIAREVLGPERAKHWPAVAEHDEKKGLPGIDPVHGGRYWPAVQRFYDKLNRLDDRASSAGPSDRPRVRIIDTAPNGEEDFSGEKNAALHGRRRDRRNIRQRA